MLVYRLFCEVTLHSWGLVLTSEGRVKCNFTKQPVDQHRLTYTNFMYIILIFVCNI